MSTPLVKYCGLSSKEDIDAAIDSGVQYVGFIHHEKSPRHLSISAINELCDDTAHVFSVVVVVNPTSETLKALENTSATHIQLHGSESFEDCLEAKSITHKKIIKACPIKNMSDIKTALTYQDYVDHLLFDAKTENPDMPGGLGISFDWTLLKNMQTANPWFLAGGLNLNNVDNALDVTHAPMLDISSGIESSSAVKDYGKMRAFMSHITNRAS